MTTENVQRIMRLIIAGRKRMDKTRSDLERYENVIFMHMDEKKCKSLPYQDGVVFRRKMLARKECADCGHASGGYERLVIERGDVR